MNPDSNDRRKRQMLGRLGALSLHSKYGGREITEKARAAFLARFEKEVDPRHELDPRERARRASNARSAYMLRLSMKSADARQHRGDRTDASSH